MESKQRPKFLYGIIIALAVLLVVAVGSLAFVIFKPTATTADPVAASQGTASEVVVEKLKDTIDIPGYESLTLKANTVNQEMPFPIRRKIPVIFRSLWGCLTGRYSGNPISLRRARPATPLC